MGRRTKKFLIGLVEKEKGREKEPSNHNEENGNDDVGNGGYEIGAEFLFEDVGYLAHASSPA
jgi:hypothetical protein